MLAHQHDNQCQFRPLPVPATRRDVRTRVTNRTLSQITWRKNVARQSPEDTDVSLMSSPT
jgi:hypothetical protein